MANTELLIDMAKDSSSLEVRIDALERQLESIRQTVEHLVDRNARTAQNQKVIRYLSNSLPRKTERIAGSYISLGRAEK